MKLSGTLDEMTRKLAEQMTGKHLSREFLEEIFFEVRKVAAFVGEIEELQAVISILGECPSSDAPRLLYRRLLEKNEVAAMEVRKRSHLAAARSRESN